MGRARRQAAGSPVHRHEAEDPRPQQGVHPLLALQRTAGNAATTALVVAQRQAQSKEDARTEVPSHVEPKPCFIWHHGSARGWTPIPGTGCAHWISHQLGITRGLKCDVGLTTRVVDVIRGMDPVTIARAQPGDIWRSTEVRSHAGIVREVLDGVGAVMVEHDSTRQNGVVTERKTSGQFFRP